MPPVWNPWHGCHKISPGCLHCYMFRRDAQFDKDSTIVKKTAAFSLPIQRKRDGSYKLLSDKQIGTCMTSDFFLEEADAWRSEAWQMIRSRPDLSFLIITKRIDRFTVRLPEDWGDGYPNVTICATCETQSMADRRLPIFLKLPIHCRQIIHEPMLEKIHIEPYLATGKIHGVICGGESGDDARLCHYDWILSSKAQCDAYRVPFWFKQTGANFQKGNKRYHIPRALQMPQARKAGLNSGRFSYPANLSNSVRKKG